MRALIRFATLLLVALITLAPFAAEPPPVAPGGFRVIVHPQHALSGADRQFIADAFLKKVTRWPDDSAIRPVDQRTVSTTRVDFTRAVLRRSVQAVKAYWQQRIFSGRDWPPPELDDEQAVLEYVLSHPGALGYVSAGFDVKEAKVLTLTD